MEIVLIVFLVLALLLVLSIMRVVARNAGVLTLEDFALRNDCSYIPVHNSLVASLGEWSQPVQVQLVPRGDRRLLVEMNIRTDTQAHTLSEE